MLSTSYLHATKLHFQYMPVSNKQKVKGRKEACFRPNQSSGLAHKHIWRSAPGRRVPPLLSGFATSKKKRYIEGTCKMQVIHAERKRTTSYRRMKHMLTTLLDQETAPGTKEDVVIAEPITAPSVKQSRPITIALTFLIGCVSLVMTGFAISMPVFPQRLQALGLGAETLALMEGAFGLGVFLFSTPIGIWAGRIGRKPILFISLAGFIVTNLALAYVNVPLLFILIRFVEGMLISGLIPASMAMVGDTIALEKQGRWIGFLTTAQATGIALGPGIGAFPTLPGTPVGEVAEKAGHRCRQFALWCPQCVHVRRSPLSTFTSGSGTGRTGLCLRRASSGRHLSGCHDR